jgi:hypothetical protein
MSQRQLLEQFSAHRSFSSLKKELTENEAIPDVRECATLYYNPKRLHLTLDYTT